MWLSVGHGSLSQESPAAALIEPAVPLSWHPVRPDQMVEAGSGRGQQQISIRPGCDVGGNCEFEFNCT